MSKDDTTRTILGPFSRIEGDLEVQVEIDQGTVSKAWVNAPLYRGYEQILQGKDPRDALVYTPRICGICSVSQSVATARAIAQAQNLSPCANGELSTSLILATENLADHLTHFYMFFMPDFARDCYTNKHWFTATGTRFKAQTGEVSREVLPARAEFLHITGLLAGKWPHSLAIQPGGSTRPLGAEERVRLQTTIANFRYFLQETMFADELEVIAELDSEQSLLSFADQHPGGDFAHFLRIADDLNLSAIGRASDVFMSYGAYPQADNYLFKPGVWDQQNMPLDTGTIREDISHSWLNLHAEPMHPFQGNTIPDDDDSNGYSWCKAPRLHSRVVEVGAIARQLINGHPLIVDLVNHSGGNVRNRVIARLLELALVLPAMESWAKQIQPGEPFCKHAELPDEAQAVGLVEAARGSLGHWLRIKNGKILNYQIIAPTTWNFSPRDSADQPGALEQALQGTELDDEQQTSTTIQHIIRSFDPCMVCTVH
ncbi:MAG: nickel-dependent hydrogenase large subunit [Gammaproteobacteria bacterium]|nr:nickel-dependent hydrogenase large subunit [Gammaproteobacteria bacterium]